MAAALRVFPIRAAIPGTDGSRSVQITSLPAGSRFRVTPEATISASQRIGAPPSSAFRAAVATPGLNRTSRARSTIPQAWIIRTTTRATSSGSPDRSASARIVANDRR